jgi:hypothetical protein
VVTLKSQSPTTPPPTKAVMSRGQAKLLDTRRAERNGDKAPGREPRNVAWTHYYGKKYPSDTASG